MNEIPKVAIVPEIKYKVVVRIIYLDTIRNQCLFKSDSFNFNFLP